MTNIVSTEHLEDLKCAIQSLRDNDTAQALEIVEGILKQDPNAPEALHLLGLCSVLLGDLGRAIELIKRAHEIDAECRDYVDALASLTARVGDMNNSLYYAKLAITLTPHPELAELTPESLVDYARALKTSTISTLMLDVHMFYLRRMFSQAVDACEKELRIKPTSVEALRMLGKSLIEIGEYPRAEIALHAAEQLQPGDVHTCTDLARCLSLQGKNDAALACFDYAREQDEEDLTATAQNLQSLSLMDDAHWQTRNQIEDIFLERCHKLGIEAMEGGDTPPQGKIRIGLLSNAFYNCDDALVLETFLRNYDHRRFEVFCLQQSATNDKTTDLFKTLCDSWRPIFNLDDWALASIIVGDGIHALIDTIGYGSGQRRATLSTRPAPVQVAWLNHLDGTGKETINLILGDAATFETDRRTVLDNQDVTLIEGGLFAFQKFVMMGKVLPLPALEHNTITFGAYADGVRINAQTARTWSKLLKAIPNSLLALNVAPNLTDQIRAQLTSLFANFGMIRRIVFLENDPASNAATISDPEQEFLAGVDVMLDSGVQTRAPQVARALWMGVPVLTQTTGRRSSHVAASVLNAAGKAQWIAASPEDFIAKAQTLTQNFEALNDIRQALRDDIEDSALFQGRDFAREIENAIVMTLEDKGII